MSTVDALADRYLDRWAALDPVSATYVGLAGGDALLTDLSPDGFAERADLDRRTLAVLHRTQPDGQEESIAHGAMSERLTLAVERYEAGETTSELNVNASPLHTLRGVFDLMPVAGPPAVAAIIARLEALPRSLDDLLQTLTLTARVGHISSRRQVLQVANQCFTWADPAGDDVWGALQRRVYAANSLATPEAAELDRVTARAREATHGFGVALRVALSPLASERQAVGRERYELASRHFLGMRVDLDEAYAWGFEELHRIEGEMRTTASEIAAGSTVDEAVASLDADPARWVVGKEAFRKWIQDLADSTLANLHGTYFDVPEPVRRIECLIAPTSDGGVYYSRPDSGSARPGRIWWAVPTGISRFSTWRETTTVYHEGVPGHHLQAGQAIVAVGRLNRWRRLVCECAGHGEGWALYAERLMDELGWLADPGDRLGMLFAQAFRACRVVIDTGMHLELTIPDNPFGFHPGRQWNPQLGWEFLRSHTRLSDEALRFELDRYLGWPGQAPAYKIGERVWRDVREDVRRRAGALFDLRAFHSSALALGPLGLEPFRAAMQEPGVP